MVGRQRSNNNMVMKFWCFLWIIAAVCYTTSEAGTTAPPDNPCGTLAEISEKLWEADNRRYNFSDVESLFPDLTNFSDAAIAEAIQMTPEESLPDIIVFLNAAKQGQNSENSTKLFQFVKRKVFTDYDDFGYIPDTLHPEPLCEEDFIGYGDRFYAIQDFLHSIEYTPVIDELSIYLNCKGVENTNGMLGLLFDMWFFGYARYYSTCGEDSSGFEYTFVGEYALEGSKVVGLHNWENLWWSEETKEMQYVSFNGLYEPNLLALSFTWNGREQSQGSVFLGTSPEFELAIYTLCFYEKVGQDCTLSLDGHEITLRTFKYDFYNRVFQAYPVIPSYSYSPDPPPTPDPYTSVECRPTTPPPGPSCEGGLSEIAERLWAADSNRLSFSDVAISSSADIVLDFSTGTKLFKYVDESKLDYPLYEALLNITDNYNPLPYYDDYVEDDEWSEVESFIELLIASRPMSELIDYLKCRGILNDQTDIEYWLWNLWFYEVYRYGETWGADSSGFEYTFVGEYGPYDNDVVGLYDWYRMYLLEKDGNLTSTSYIDLSEPNLLEVSFTLEDYVKNDGAVLLGSSIEFQMAVYTLCYMEMPGSLCPLTMGGRVVTLMTLDRGTIEAAYPVSTSPTTTAASTTQPTTTPPPSTACDSLSEIAEKLWTADSNRLSFSDVAISSSADIVLDFNTGTKLFLYVDESKLDNSLYEALQNLTDSYGTEDSYTYYDYYNYLYYSNDYNSAEENFIELVIATDPMKELINYLTCKGRLADQADLKYWLLDLWFNEFYSYTDAYGGDSTGFKYTFVGGFDTYRNDVVGLHDWYRLYVLERDENLNYTGYLDLSEPNLLEVSFTWDGHVNNHGAVLLGSSIEFQMAIYTLCYMEMPGSLCSLTMGGRVVTLMTVDSDGTIEAAYPVSTSATTTIAAALGTTTTPIAQPSTTTTIFSTSSTTTATSPTTTQSTTPISTTATTTPTPTSTTTTTTTTPTPTTTTATPTCTTTTTTTTPTSTTTTPTSTTTTPTSTTTTTTTTTPTPTTITTSATTTRTTTTPTPAPIGGKPRTVKTPTTTSSSSFPCSGGAIMLLVLQSVLHWLL